MRNGIFNSILPSEEDCNLPPEENLEPNSAGLKSSQTRGVWHKSLEESHSAQIKEKSMLGHLVYSEETTKKFLESDIFRILKSEGITEIGALYKVSPSMFVLVFGSKTTKQKLQGTEIQCRFGDLEVFLNFCKRVGALTNGREPIFVTILFLEFISDQPVDKSNFGEVVSALKGRHKFNRSIRNGKRHVRMFPVGGDPDIVKENFFPWKYPQRCREKGGVVLQVQNSTRHMLGENGPVLTLTQKDSSMSFTEQSVTPSHNQNSIQPDPSAEILPCVAYLQQASAPIEDVDRGDHSEEASDSDSDSVSKSESCSDFGSHSESGSGSVASLEESLIPPSSKSYLKILKIKPVWEGLLHRCQIHSSEG